MNYDDIIEIDEDAEMIDLGTASLETEGVGTAGIETDGMGNTSYSHD